MIELYDAAELPEGELDEQGRAELKQAIDESRAEEKAGKVRPAEDLIAELRASR